MSTIVTEKLYSVPLLRSHPDKIFVFGDNMLRYGKAGQSIIRYEPNAFGIVTKRKPSMEHDAFFSDMLDEMTMITFDLERLFLISLSKDIVFPIGGIGTGLSKLKRNSPFIWETLNSQLLFYFGYKNPI